MCNISSLLLSSVKTILKKDNDIASSLTSASEAAQKWKEEEDKSNILRFYLKESPELYYLKNKYNMTKYIDLLSTDVS